MTARRLAIGGLLALGLLFAAGLAQAQQPVITNPSQTSASHDGGTIAVTSTFQSIWSSAGPGTPSAARRNGCLVLNYGANPMWVYFGPIANASKAQAVELVASSSTEIVGVGCATGGGGVIQDQVSITGTSGDTFYASQQ